MKIKISGKEINIIIILLAIICIAASVYIVKTYVPIEENMEEYKNKTVSSAPSTQNELVSNPIDFDDLQKENADVCAWIKIEGTDIDYPIMQSGEKTEEDFYLNHNWHKENKKAGALYIQKVNSADFSDRNTVIYGHNMKNSTMFGTLKKFKNKNYFNEHPKMFVYIKGHILEYEIYSAFTFDDRHLMYAYDFNLDESYGEFIKNTLNPQSKTQNVRASSRVSTADKVITLSTCTSKDNERYLVVGVLKSDTLTK